MSWPARLKRASRGKIYFCTKEKSGLQPILSAKSGNIQDSNEDKTKMKKQINPTIKAHLIRGAFYLLLLVAVCAIPFALAQRNATKRGVANPASNANMAAKFAAAPPATGAAQATKLSGVHSKGASQSNAGTPLLPYDVRRFPGVPRVSSAMRGRSPVAARAT